MIVAAKDKGQDKLSLDTHLMDIYLTGLQSEIEAKLRRLAKFREQMKRIDAAGGTTDKKARLHAAHVLLAQIDQMLKTNLDVRETLAELKVVAQAVLKDVKALGGRSYQT